MNTRFLLGPAGSGKTFRCLAEIRAALAEPEGPPLLLIAPKQTTYQLERALLDDPSLPGYTRLRILSFERLAFFIFELLQKPAPRMLNEEGRLMVLRGLLARKRDELKLFRASARLTGFAQQLSLVLRELQRQQLTPESLQSLAEKFSEFQSLSFKLHDLATLLRDYLDWLAARNLQDADHLLDAATLALQSPGATLNLGDIWVDGFTDLPPQELDLLAELLPHAPNATITFCLDREPAAKISWLSTWAVVRRAYDQCRERLAQLPNVQLNVEVLPRRPEKNRFENNFILQHLEANWAEPRPLPLIRSSDTFCPTGGEGRDEGERSSKNAANSFDDIAKSIRVAECANPVAEATLAAREILRFVRAGGRYREVTVLARNLQSYHAALVNVFTRYEIPYFLDRRESVSHHPLAELSRNALRTIAFSWTHKDWFGALKTGLVLPGRETDIDQLENEALARGWKGRAWHSALTIADDPENRAEQMERIRRKIVPPFERLELRLKQHGGALNGPQLAEALRDLWQALNIFETLEKWTAQDDKPNPIHLTVWEQLDTWLENVEMAFPAESLSLRDWLPILEAGLAGLTVGVIPPALDQVLVGAIDRSRNPDIRLALVLGMNETVFPASPAASALLTETDRAELEKQGVQLASERRQLSHERFYGYIACTRARERLVLTFSDADASGKKLNPSPFLSHIKKLFPAIEFEEVPRALNWRESEHPTELIVPLLRNQARGDAHKITGLERMNDLPAIAELREQLRHLIATPGVESLAPPLARRLYGDALRTSVSRMEQFAACPFKFFVHSGLHAQERTLFELDIRDQGNFQHKVLDEFHQSLRDENKSWRDITPDDAAARVATIAAAIMVNFRDGLLQATEQSKFTARMLAFALEDFVKTLVGWMRGQYAFEPTAVELPFGENPESFPPWELDLEGGARLLLHGRIDRIDLCAIPGTDSSLCVVVDYKSSQKKLDALLMHHGLQLQLPAYLNVLRHWKNPQPLFGVGELVPAGVFYVNLRGKYERANNRDESLSGVDDARKSAYRHSGRFDAAALANLDQRPGATDGDQFNYRRKQNAELYANTPEAMPHEKFIAMLDGVESELKRMGREIYEGVAKVDPYRKGTMTACQQCDYRAICRIDSWTHIFRVLRMPEEKSIDE